MNTKKTCCRCKEEKDLDEFHRATSRRDGHGTMCKACCHIQAKKNWAGRKQRQARPKFHGWLEEAGETLRTSGPPLDYSLIYPCMKEGGSCRPVPLGRTKRQAYCSRCTVDKCIHYDATPRMVRLGVAARTKYPAQAIWAMMRYGPNRQEVEE